MGWWSSLRGKVRDSRQVDDAVTAHLREFAARPGVEAWIEPPTNLNPPSILLVAGDGAWTRRKVPSQQWAVAWCRRENITAYEAGVVGYPQRMRDHDERLRIQRRRQAEGRS